MVGARRLALGLCAALLALGGLSGCQKAHQVSQGIDKARDCASVLREVANLNINIDAQSAARTAAKARDTAERLDRVARGVDQTDVRNAAEDLAARLKSLASKANNTTPAQLEKQISAVTQAAARLARTCNVPLDQVIQTR